MLDDRYREIEGSPFPILAPKPSADDGGRALAEALKRLAKPKNPKKLNRRRPK